MAASLDLWIEYLIRFSHLVAGIAWIGSSFYFIWLDSSFETPESPRHNVEGEVFMVHGGFYYQVEKKKIAPGEIPRTLHWFKWEATLTLITGLMLFTYLYLLNGASLMVDRSVMDLTQWQVIGLSVFLILTTWVNYDFMFRKDIIKSEKLGTFLFVLYLAALIYTCFHLFSGRGAFIILGVIMGTLMVLNVWVRILPGQSRMLAAAQAGETPDYSESLKSKVRSVHNTYFIFPVLFIMLSNHYPGLYNHDLNWLLLVVLGISGALVRHVMVSKNVKHRALLVPALLGLLFLIIMTAKTSEVAAVNLDASEVSYELDIEPLVSKHCLSCHSHNNTDQAFRVAPKGLVFESEISLVKNKDKIVQQVYDYKVMPLGNQSGMTLEERQKLFIWLHGQ